MTDLVERLRAMHVSAPSIPSCALCSEAAEEIERLTAQSKTLARNYDKANLRYCRVITENEHLRVLLRESLSLTEGLDDDSYLEPEHRACLIQWRDEALAAVEGDDE